MEWFPIIVFLVLLALNLQVAFAIAIASLSFFMMSSGVPQELFIQRFVAVTHSFPLLAVPFFILAGGRDERIGQCRCGHAKQNLSAGNDKTRL